MSPARKNSESLSGIVKIGAIVLVVCLGMWGCARKPASSVENTALETKVAKLEQDLRNANNGRDKARKEIAALETEVARLQIEANEKVLLANEKVVLLEKIKASQSERDDLRQQVAQRIVERDTLSLRVDKFRKGMAQLMAQDENPGANIPGIPTTPTTPSATGAVSTTPSLGGNS